MQIITLPEYLKIKYAAPVQLFDYRTFNSCLRSKIHLTKNTFSFLLEGTKEVITDNTSTKIDNRAFLILKSGNCLMTENVSPDQKAYKSMLLFFTDEVLLDFLKKYDFDSNTSKTAPSFLVGQYDPYIKQFVQSLESIYQLEKAIQKKLLRVKFEEIMLYLVQNKGPSFLNALLHNYDSKVIRLVNVVEHNKLNKLSLQELAFLCNMSLSSFKREFAKQYQTTPIKWFQEKRLEHSAFLLRTQKKRPIEIFEETGYENLSNFIQAFKKRYGITPKQFQVEQMDF